MERKLYSTGFKYEKLASYSAAIRVGNTIEVAGIIAVDEHDQLVGGSDVGLQAKYIFEQIAKILVEAGASLKNVTRTRMFVTDISAAGETVTALHQNIFKGIRPVATMVEVSRLIRPDVLIEIEVSAIG